MGAMTEHRVMHGYQGCLVAVIAYHSLQLLHKFFPAFYLALIVHVRMVVPVSEIPLGIDNYKGYLVIYVDFLQRTTVVGHKSILIAKHFTYIGCLPLQPLQAFGIPVVVPRDEKRPAPVSFEGS